MTRKQRKELLEELEQIEKTTQHYAEYPQDGSFGFFAHCQMPDTLQRTRDALQPWYVHLWWRIRNVFWRIFPSDEIPF